MASKPKEILRQAVDLDADQMRNDFDGDMKITAADARLAERQNAGMEPQSVNGLTYQYLQEANKYLDAYKNNKYNYDFYSDPVYQQAREAYMRQGQLAAKDVQAQAAGLTGGYGNSYGAMAAQQQYNAALDNLNNIVPQLEQNAYARYQDEQNKNLTLTQLYLDRENNAYNRAYNEAALAAQYKDYKGLNQLGIDTGHYEDLEKVEEDWAALQRERTQKEWDQADTTFAWNIALNAAQFKDYSKLKELGIDVSSQEKQDLIDRAITWAQYGDYSLLAELGVDTSYLQALQNYELAQNEYNLSMMYGSGSSSSGSSGGGGGSSRKNKTKTNPGTNPTTNPTTDQSTQQSSNASKHWNDAAATGAVVNEWNREAGYQRYGQPTASGTLVVDTKTGQMANVKVSKNGDVTSEKVKKAGGFMTQLTGKIWN